MKVYVYPADTHGCGFYRMIWPARALRAQGHDVEIIMPKQRGNSLRAAMRDGHVIDVTWPDDADVIVLQRITHQHLVEAIQLMTQRGVTVIIDMDDDLAAIDPNNPAWRALHPSYGHNPLHNWTNAQRACDAATFVTVSADALLPRYARHNQGAVLHNYVPARYLEIEHIDSDTLGWGGALHVHPGDVQVMGHVISTLTGEGRQFKVIGPGDGIAHVLNCRADRIDATGNLDLQTEWPQGIATLGVGVAPLADTRFNTAKSRLKILEYSALGVPWIASPRIEYRRVHETHGIGLLADKPKQWLRHARTLLGSESQRCEMSESGRAWASTQTIESNAWRWFEAWSNACKNY